GEVDRARYGRGQSALVHERGVEGHPVATLMSEISDRLDDIGLAGPVVGHECGDPGSELEVELRIGPNVTQGESGYPHSDAGGHEQVAIRLVGGSGECLLPGDDDRLHRPGRRGVDIRALAP